MIMVEKCAGVSCRVSSLKNDESKSALDECIRCITDDSRLYVL